jgi:hypothetical protein
MQQLHEALLPADMPRFRAKDSLRRRPYGSKEPYQRQEYELLLKPGSYSTLKSWGPELDATTA